jgi:hypothetical protein
VHAGAQHRPVTGDLDLSQPLEGCVGCLDGIGGSLEHGHVPVAEALDELAAVAADRRLHAPADHAEQLEGVCVPCRECPLRELDQVGEEDRESYSAPGLPAGVGQTVAAG